MTIPDAIEPVVGYRAWKVGDDWRLRSTGISVSSWDTGPNEAFCFAEDKTKRVLRNTETGVEWFDYVTHGRIPEPTCNCGFWLLKDLARCYEHLTGRARMISFGGMMVSWAGIDPEPLDMGTPVDPPPSGFVFGMVKGWGRTIQGEHGYRCEFAEVTEFLTGTRPDVVSGKALERLAQTYAVSIVADPALDKPKPVKKAQPYYRQIEHGKQRATINWVGSGGNRGA